MYSAPTVKLQGVGDSYIQLQAAADTMKTNLSARAKEFHWLTSVGRN